MTAAEPPESLIEQALAAPEDTSERWELTRALCARGDRETLDAVGALIDHEDPARRVLAADVLGQFGSTGELPDPFAADGGDPTLRPFWDDLAALVNARIPNEHEPVALQSAIAAAGHLRDPRSLPLLLGRRTHGDPWVRWSIVMAIGGLDDDAAIDALVEFLADPSPLVRDWAAFAFGVTQPAQDGPAIRAALLALLSDEDLVARSEAMRALARRGASADIIDALVDTLPHREELDNWDPLDEALLLAAADTADPRLRDWVLLELRRWDEAGGGPDMEPLPAELEAAVLAYA